MMPGPTQILVVIILIALLFGSKKIPDIARSLGRSMGEFKKGQKEGEELMNKSELSDDEKKAEQEKQTKED